MDKVKKLRADRAAKLAELEALNEKAMAEDRDLTEVEVEAYRACKAEIEALDARIARALEVEELRAKTVAKTVDKALAQSGDEPDDEPAKAGADDEFKTAMKGLSLFFGGAGREQRPAVKKSSTDFGIPCITTRRTSLLSMPIPKAQVEQTMFSSFAKNFRSISSRFLGGSPAW